jgi:hypothetical protein
MKLLQNLLQNLRGTLAYESRDEIIQRKADEQMSIGDRIDSLTRWSTDPDADVSDELSALHKRLADLEAELSQM